MTDGEIYHWLQALINIAKKKKTGKRLNKADKSRLDSFISSQLETEPDARPWILDNQEQAADAFQITARTIRDWKKKGMPMTPDGRYDPVEIERWRFRYFELKEKEDIPPEETKEHWEKEWKKAKAQLAEIDLRIRKGELLEIDVVENGRVNRILTIKTELLSLPNHVAPSLVGLTVKQVKNLLEARINECIRTFSGQKR